MIELWSIGLSPRETAPLNNFFKKRIPHFSLALPTIAALTPSSIPLKIKERLVDKLEPESDTKLVGISLRTFEAPEGYRIAKYLKRKGIKTVAGGIHPTMLPEEALKNGFDSVVVGEAELVWGNLLDDFLKGKLKKIYRPDRLIEPSEFVIPKRELLDKPFTYRTDSLQTRKGCPNECNFCSTPALYSMFPGKRYRDKSADMILKELENISKYFIIIDDNPFIGRKDRDHLLKEFSAYNKRYFTQVDVSIGRDEKFLKILYESGCRIVALGLDSVSKESLKSIGKSPGLIRDYKDNIKRIKNAGIKVALNIIFGSDADTESIFDETHEFLYSVKPFEINPHILTSYPGTPLWKTLEDRLIYKRDSYPEAWKHHSTYEVVFKPQNFTPEKLEEGFYNFCKENYSFFNRMKTLDKKDKWFGLPSVVWYNFWKTKPNNNQLFN